MQFGQMALKFMSSGLMSFGQTPTGLFREDVIEIYVIWTVLHWALVQCHSGRCCWHLTSGHLQHTLNLKADSTFLSKRPPLKLFFLLMAAAIEFPVSKKKRGSAKTCKKAAERERECMPFPGIGYLNLILKSSTGSLYDRDDVESVEWTRKI